jgi:choline dehydrogenase
MLHTKLTSRRATTFDHGRRQPAGFLELFNQDRDWQFRTVAQEKQNDRVSHWPRGKELGGCSANNAMLYVRGDPRNYDEWASKYGCDGWSYADLLPYFKKSEDCTAVGVDDEFHSRGGELAVQHPARGSPNVWAQRIVAAGVEAGLAENKDVNGASPTGIGIAQVTVRDGVRASTATAFLTPDVRARSNLTIRSLCHVTRVVVQGTRAVGVTYRQGELDHDRARRSAHAAGFEKYMAARREVIVCAGAVCSPWLLMQSGIGPRGQLDAARIPVVVDVQGVGQNLQDHLFYPLAWATIDRESYNYVLQSAVARVAAVLQYAALGTGPCSSCGLEALAFTNTGLTEETHNDLQVHIYTAANENNPDKLKAQFGIETEGRIEQPDYGVTLLPSLLRPYSVGSITLNTDDPAAYPTIDPRYLSDERDLDVLVAGGRLAERVMQQPSLKGLIGDLIIDTTIEHAPGSDAYIREFVRRYAVTIYHPCGTCKMGPLSDPTTVVDTRLRVRGVQGLRVCDASIMPRIISGNTNAICIAIGEKAADLILADQAALGN